jgi:hypothetical protein
LLSILRAAGKGGSKLVAMSEAEALSDWDFVEPNRSDRAIQRGYVRYSRKLIQ